VILDALLGTLGLLDPITATWGPIDIVFPTSAGANSDVTVSFQSGGVRSLSATYGGQDLHYRINSGAWTAYAGPFSVTSGQTVGWRYSVSYNESFSLTVRDDTRGATISAFSVSASGFP
jgi:hypothetical protein